MKSEPVNTSGAGGGLHWPIGVKLTIAFLALAIIPMSATAYYNLIQDRRTVAEITRENLVELSRGTAQHIGLLLTEEILSNVVDRHAISGEYPWNGHEQLLRFRLAL